MVQKELSQAYTVTTDVHNPLYTLQFWKKKSIWAFCELFVNFLQC